MSCCAGLGYCEGRCVCAGEFWGTSDVVLYRYLVCPSVRLFASVFRFYKSTNILLHQILIILSEITGVNLQQLPLKLCESRVSCMQIGRHGMEKIALMEDLARQGRRLPSPIALL